MPDHELLGFAKPGDFILQSVAALLQGFIRTFNTGQFTLCDLQGLSPLSEKLLLRMLILLQLPRLGEQARVVAVQLGQLILLDDQGLL